MNEGLPFGPQDLASTPSIATETLLDGINVSVENATVYTNVAALNPPFGQHLLRDIYVPRQSRLAPVTLSQLAPDAILYGGGEFLVATAGRLLSRQVAPYLQQDQERIGALLSTPRATVHIADECLLVARFGIYTWGHWLAELLPTVVLAEAAYPGRFKFALPYQVLGDANPNLPWMRIRETLLVYGVGSDRILSLSDTSNYSFDQLHLIDNVWSDHLMHPSALEQMRSKLPRGFSKSASAQAKRRIALLRVGEGRSLENLNEIRPFLEGKGFEFHTVGTMPFGEQVRLFQQASVIFSVLGSDLSGLVYAPEGVRVLSAAPPNFGDRFFYALILDRHGRYADVRGPIVEQNEAVAHRSSFRVELDELSNALARLEVNP